MIRNHLVLHQFLSSEDGDGLEGVARTEANNDGIKSYFSEITNDTFLREIRWFRLFTKAEQFTLLMFQFFGGMVVSSNGLRYTRLHGNALTKDTKR